MRVAFDLDGVLADFAGAYLEVERRFFWAGEADADRDVPPPEEIAGDPGGGDRKPGSRDSTPGAGSAGREPRASKLAAARKREAIWDAIRSTGNFWTTLAPIDRAAVPRIHAAAMDRRWDVFFITQRPATAGDTVQRQTQRWLAAHGFDLPSVIVLPGSRGKAACALHLDYLVDDRPQNCVDVLADSTTRTLLVVPAPDSTTETSAHRLGIHVVRSIADALDYLEQDPQEPAPTTLLQRVRRSLFP